MTCNVRGRDLGSFVAEARAEARGRGAAAVGRATTSSGAASSSTSSAPATGCCIVVPLALLLILRLLVPDLPQLSSTSLRVFTGVPFGAVGGILALWLRDMPFSISAAVGFIALSGVAVLDDMILVSYIRQLRAQGPAAGRGGAAGGRDAAAAGADDDAGGQPGLRADGLQHRHGRRGAAAAGHGGHRRRHQRHGDVAVRGARPVSGLSSRLWTRKRRRPLPCRIAAKAQTEFCLTTKKGASPRRQP